MAEDIHKKEPSDPAEIRNVPRFAERQQRQLEQMYQSEDRTEMRAEILRALQLREGERVLELGSGPGELARVIALAVGAPGKVTGIDLNAGLVEMAAARCGGMPWVNFVEGNIEEPLPFPDGAFDAVTAAAVLQYVAEADLDGVLAEAYRVLGPLGRILIHDSEWATMVRYSRHPERNERVLAAWRSVFANPHLFQTLAPKLRKAGFVLQRRDALPTFHPELRRNTLDYDGTDFLVELVAGRQGVTREEAEAWAEEQFQLGREGAYFSCTLRFCYVAVKLVGGG